MGFLDRYKDKRKLKLMKELEDIEFESSSSVFVKRFVLVILDILSWVIVAYFVYIWYQTRAQPVSCDRITPDFCGYCFNQVNQINSSLLGLV